jgi:hypothetical protein
MSDDDLGEGDRRRRPRDDVELPENPAAIRRRNKVEASVMAVVDSLGKFYQDIDMDTGLQVKRYT